jgi:copper ion binding protein
METETIKVLGMTCGGCVKSIENALAIYDGIHRTSADLDAGTVSVEFDGKRVQRSEIERAISEAGFDVPAQ